MVRNLINRPDDLLNRPDDLLSWLLIEFSRCTDTSDLRHFGPRTFRHHVFGAEVSQIFALVPKCPLVIGIY